MEPTAKTGGLVVPPLQGRATCLRVYVNEADRWRGHLLARAIITAALDQGLAGASAYVAVDGFGARRHVHSVNLIETEANLPVVIECIDERDRIADFLVHIEPMVRGGIATMEDVQTTSIPPRSTGAGEAPIDRR